MTVPSHVHQRVGFKFSPEFERGVRRAVSSHESDHDIFFDGMRLRTYMGEMRYERDTQNRWQYPGEPFIGKTGYAFCSWPIHVYMRGLRRKIDVFVKGGSDVEAGNREFLMDVGNYAAFLYILDDHLDNNYHSSIYHKYHHMPILYDFYARLRNKRILVDIGACALREFCDPRHPNSHYHVHDQTLKTGTGAVGRTPVF